MSENHFDPVLQELSERAVGRLAIAEIFDTAAFDALENYLWEEAKGLRNEPSIFKQVLFSVRSAASTIRSRAEYLPSVSAHIGRADDFDMMLDRLIAGETRLDRLAGVPRTI